MISQGKVCEISKHNHLKKINESPESRRSDSSTASSRRKVLLANVISEERLVIFITNLGKICGHFGNSKLVYKFLGCQNHNELETSGNFDLVK